MAKYICIRECFHNATRFVPGDYVKAPEGVEMPRHFKRLDSPVNEESLAKETKEASVREQLERYGVKAHPNAKEETLKAKLEKVQGERSERLANAQRKAVELNLDVPPDAPLETLEHLIEAWEEDAKANAPA